MFCYQCQETVKNTGCTVKGVCGKPEETANLQDLLIYALKGISIYGVMLKELGAPDRDNDLFIIQRLFMTITNADWDDQRFVASIKEALARRDQLKARFMEAYREKNGRDFDEPLHDSATWYADDAAAYAEKAKSVGILATEDEDVRSLQYLLIFGLKGISAYAEHAAVLGFTSDEISDFIMEGLASTTRILAVDEMVALVLKAGETAVKTMALLDEANTTTYGNPEITEVNIGVRDNPGILISGHDLKDMEELLQQTEGTGVDVYTHGEMLPANYYPAFKKYDHLVGNYGGSWWHQISEFESFNGPILLTTNCLVPLKKESTYLDRLFTTGMVGYPGARHIADRPEGGSQGLLCHHRNGAEAARPQRARDRHHRRRVCPSTRCWPWRTRWWRRSSPAPSNVLSSWPAATDGRKRGATSPRWPRTCRKDTVILTAGCAKYRYNKLDLGDIGGIPRVLDAGQCNDSYSLAVIALKLQEVFGLSDINELPLSFDIAWYEQKAVAVLLALLSLGVQGHAPGPDPAGFSVAGGGQGAGGEVQHHTHR